MTSRLNDWRPTVPDFSASAAFRDRWDDWTEAVLAPRELLRDAIALCDDLDRLRVENEHLAGALERATVGQQDPITLRLGSRPVDTGNQPPPDLEEMRRLMTARREHGCVAVSVWLHDMQWILDRLASLSADSHRVRQQRQTALQRAEQWERAAADCAEERRRLRAELEERRPR